MSCTKSIMWLVVVAACGAEPANPPDAPAGGEGEQAADANEAAIDAAADAAADARPDAPVARPRVVYVVRHAETTGIGNDPTLSADGQLRAGRLADRLAAGHVVAVLTSQYRRTRDTGVPTATAAGLTVETIAATSANATTYGAELATAARNHAGTGDVLIVGHSNTVPDTVIALGGSMVTPISETEFNRIYTITLAPEGPRVVESTY